MMSSPIPEELQDTRGLSTLAQDPGRLDEHLAFKKSSYAYGSGESLIDSVAVASRSKPRLTNNKSKRTSVGIESKPTYILKSSVGHGQHVTDNLY
jgi:hypothetical protein